MLVALTNKRRTGLDDIAENGIGRCGNRDALDAFVVEAWTVVEAAPIPTNARAAFEDEERDARGELRMLFEKQRQNLGQRRAVVDLSERLTQDLERAPSSVTTTAAASARQVRDLAHESENAFLVDVLIVVRHLILKSIESLEELVLKTGDLLAEIIRPRRHERVKHG